MKEPTYEVNTEKLESLSMADITGLITLNRLYPIAGTNSWKLTKVLTEELDKRINDIIIF